MVFIGALFISVTVVLLVIFLIISLQCITDKSLSYITTSADTNIESRLRLLMLKNPKSEIYVIDRTNSDETKEILEKLEKDFPNIHVVLP